MNGSYFQKMWFGVIVIFFYFSKISKPSTINKYYFCNQKNMLLKIFFTSKYSTSITPYYQELDLPNNTLGDDPED